MSDVDVIVLDVDGGSMLEECLDSIQHQTVQAALSAMTLAELAGPPRAPLLGIEAARANAPALRS